MGESYILMGVLGGWKETINEPHLHKCLKVLLLDVSEETNDAVGVIWLPFLTLYWFNKDRPLPLHYYTHRFAESASLCCTDY